MRSIYGVGAFALLAACANDTTVHEVVTPSVGVPYTDAEFAWSAAPGTNALEADTLLRTPRGNVKTCAGLTAQLLPRTPYGTALIALIFTNDDADFSPGAIAERKLESAPPGVTRYWRRAQCNGEGHFAFAHLPDGDYYAITNVTWDAPSILSGTVLPPVEGGVLMQRIHLAGGETKHIVMSGTSKGQDIFN